MYKTPAQPPYTVITPQRPYWTLCESVCLHVGLCVQLCGVGAGGREERKNNLVVEVESKSSLDISHLRSKIPRF